MTYSAAKSIGLRVKHVPHNLRQAFTERAARALIFHGGDTVKSKYDLRVFDNNGEWLSLVQAAKREMIGHFDAEIIHKAEFVIGNP